MGAIKKSNAIVDQKMVCLMVTQVAFCVLKTICVCTYIHKTNYVRFLSDLVAQVVLICFKLHICCSIQLFLESGW